MSLLYDETTATVISYHVSGEISQSVTQIKSKSLDGTVYLQTLGDPETDISGTAYVNRAGKASLEAARAGCNLLRAELKHGTYRGRLTELKFSDRMAGDRFTADFTLAKEVSV